MRASVRRVCIPRAVFVAFAVITPSSSALAAGGLVDGSLGRADSVFAVPDRLDLGPVAWQEKMYGLGASRAATGDVAGAAAILENIDLSTPGFAHADRAAFLLAECYVQLGAWSQLEVLAERVETWPEPSAMIAWITELEALAAIRGHGQKGRRSESNSYEQTHAHPGAQGLDRSDPADQAASFPHGTRAAMDREDLALLRVIDLLANGDPHAALDLLGRIEVSTEARVLAWHLESLANERSGRVDRALLERLATAEGRASADADWIGGAALRLAESDAASGKDPRPWLERVPRESVLAPWARHIAAGWLREQGDLPDAMRELRRVLSEWPAYPARRWALLDLASLSIDEGDPEAARELGLEAERAREEAAFTLEQLRDARSIDHLWSAWADSATTASLDPASLDPVRRALWQVAIAPSAERARWPLLPGVEAARGSLVPPPPLGEMREACAREAAAWSAHATLEASRRRVEQRRREMDRLRAYLGTGLAQAESELAALDSLLSLLRDLQARRRQVVQELTTLEAQALTRLELRTEELVVRAEKRAAWARALEQIRVPSAHEPKFYPPGIPYAGDLLAAESAFADTTVSWLREYEQSAARSITESADRLRQRLEVDLDDLLARATTLRNEAERMRVDLVEAIAAAEKDPQLARLHAAVREHTAEADSLALRSLSFRRSLAERAVDAERERIDAERPVAEGLIALATYELCVPGGPRPDLRAECRQRIESYLAEHAERPMRAELRYRLADLLATEERTQFDAAMAEFLARGGPAPMLDLSASRHQYAMLLAEAPDFPHVDGVLFQLGLLEAEDGDPLCLDHLGAVPVTSPFRQAAILRRADHLFDEERLAEAMPNYEEAANGEDPALRVVALYKLGWSHFRQDGFEEAADAFRRTLDVLLDPSVSSKVDPIGTDGDSAAQRPVPDLRKEAEDYLVHCLTRAGGGPVAAKYFDRIGRRDYEPRVILQVGQLLRRFSLFADAAESDRIWLERYPLSPGAVDVARGLVESWELGNRSREARSARLELSPLFLPGSEWHAAQESDSLRKDGEAFAQAAMRSVAWELHRQARQSRTKEDWQRTLDLYVGLLETWPAGEHASRDALHAGEAALHLAAYDRAIELYSRAAGDTDPDSEPEATFTTADQDSIRATARWQRVAALDAWYESTRGAIDGATSDETTHGTSRGAGDPLVARQLLDRSGEYLDRSDWTRAALARGTGAAGITSTATRRTGDTFDLPTLSWRRASIALLHGEDALGAAELGRFLERCPDDGRAVEAAALQGDAYTRLSQHEAAAEAYAYGLRLAERRGDAGQVADLKRAVPLAHFRHAETMESRGESPSLVAVYFRELAESWPAFEHADQCLYRAGLLHRDQGQTEEAIAAWSAIADLYPGSNYVRDAELESIRLLESAGEKARAADRLESFAEHRPDDPESAGALLRAAELWEEDGDVNEAERVQLLYLDRHPEDRESELAFLAPMVERALERVDEARPIAQVLRDEPVVARYLEASVTRPDLADPRIAARVDFLRGEEQRGSFEALSLEAPLDESLADKRKSLDALIAAYRDCMTRSVAPWNHASGYRVGEALATFGEALEKVEPPSELGEEDAEAYRDVLADEAWTFYDQAEEVWAELLRGVQTAGLADNDWTEKSRRALWSRLPLRFLQLAAVDYPVVPAALPEAE